MFYFFGMVILTIFRFADLGRALWVGGLGRGEIDPAKVVMMSIGSS